MIIRDPHRSEEGEMVEKPRNQFESQLSRSQKNKLKRLVKSMHRIMESSDSSTHYVNLGFVQSSWDHQLKLD